MIRRLPVIPALLVFLSACSDPVSRENYARVESDMPEARVIEILGEPDRSRSAQVGGVSGTQHSWEGDGFVISVQFLNGQVVSKQLTPSD